MKLKYWLIGMINLRGLAAVDSIKRLHVKLRKIQLYFDFLGASITVLSLLQACSITRRKKCPNTEFFLVIIFPHSVQIRENADQKKVRIWIFMNKSMPGPHTKKVGWEITVLKDTLNKIAFLMLDNIIINYRKQDDSYFRIGIVSQRPLNCN